MGGVLERCCVGRVCGVVHHPHRTHDLSRKQILGEQEKKPLYLCASPLPLYILCAFGIVKKP